MSGHSVPERRARGVDQPLGGRSEPDCWRQLRTMRDGEGRTLTLYGNCDTGGEEGWCPRLKAMYESFEAGARTRALPPDTEAGIDAWLDRLVAEDSHHVLAVDGETVVGHAMLVPDGSGRHEFAIFVRGPYHGAGIGSELRDSVLAMAGRRGVGPVWALVDEHNDAAVRLCKAGGFERSSSVGSSLILERHLQ